MPPKGWKKDQQAPAATAAPKAPAAKAPAPKKATRKVASAAPTMLNPSPPPGVGVVRSASVDLDAAVKTAAIAINVVAQSRVMLSSAEGASKEIAQELEDLVLRAARHIDRLRASLPYGEPVALASSEPAGKQLGLKELQEIKAKQQEAMSRPLPPAPVTPAPSGLAPAPFVPMGAPIAQS